jgi:hypothetical protein
VPRARTTLQLLASLTLGALFSLGKLAYACRIPDSEACVWGKAYRAIALPLETIVVGAVIFVVLRIVTRPRTP